MSHGDVITYTPYRSDIAAAAAAAAAAVDDDDDDETGESSEQSCGMWCYCGDGGRRRVGSHTGGGLGDSLHSGRSSC